MSEVSTTDGTRHVGHIIDRGAGLETFDAEGNYLCKCATIGEARTTITPCRPPAKGAVRPQRRYRWSPAMTAALYRLALAVVFIAVIAVTLG